jgi:FtsP/CotA-like multicopper oxidase with cupredoxin domain
LALAGHSFHVIALDGAPVASPRTVPFVDLGPGERADVIVEMKNPGVWILGELKDAERNGGMGIVVEYADQKGPARWIAPSPIPWDYTLFGRDATVPEPDGRIPLVIRQPPGEHRWTINGKSFPKTDTILVERGRRYRMLFDNQTADPHPLHLHRHTFELTRVADRRTSGLFKDVVVVPGWRQVEADFVASKSGTHAVSLPSAVPHGFRIHGDVAVPRLTACLLPLKRLHVRNQVGNTHLRDGKRCFCRWI